jgi:dTDP-4-dehydrorhamnose 3,5-epimerase
VNIIKTDIEGLFIIEPTVFSDDRGFFMETYNADRYAGAGIAERFVQDNLSCSKKGVLRGLHYQLPPFAQAKLASVISGSVFDVAVDIREGSLTFGKYVSVELSADNRRQFFIPAGFAHGFLALEDDTVFQYKCTNPYSPEHDRGIRYDDPAIGIAWPGGSFTVSEKDKRQPLLSASETM